MFPIGDRAGRVIAFGGRTLGDGQPKYLNSPERPLFEKGRVLYGWSAARANSAREAEAGGPGAIVAEGYMDVIALHRAGFAAAVAPLGTALTETQLQELWRLAPEPVLCFDGDAAGQRAALRALHRALPLLQPGRSLRFATLPPGEDPDSLVRQGGRAAFAAVLARRGRCRRCCGRPNWGAADRHAGAPRRSRAPADGAGRLIADRTVQAEYRRFLRDRLFAHGRPPRGRSGERSPGQPEFALRAAAGRRVSWRGPAPPPAPGRRQREILFGMFLDHPF